MHGHKESNKDLNLKMLTSEWDSPNVVDWFAILSRATLAPVDYINKHFNIHHDHYNQIKDTRYSSQMQQHIFPHLPSKRS